MILAPEQGRQFACARDGDKRGFGKAAPEIQDDVVAFDMDRSIVYQSRNQPARIYAEIEFPEVLFPRQVNDVRLPLYSLEIEVHAQFLRA
jgi:hypothetical protein